ncbi:MULTISPECIES: hypothetical protein [unclassified Streptomyces]|uniref:hypothetical protein n=1 Tax=unclassified Streptomyces TaxID=2593676 RepID=UPI000DB9F845|nr:MULTISPECIES: hypothetical protein [unclassified Streptomyces]MYT72025.1 hypothetical protein [Streptomyces sp. SID8367]RAJ69519.1 hypothetical protein K377_08020 [Streptomyces sp. PsTaAH-137]
MPRPTVAQLAYGSATVVLSTLAMLLLSQTSSGPGVGVIAMSAVILGLFVALSVPKPKQTPAQEPAEPSAEAAREREPVHETAGP